MCMHDIMNIWIGILMTVIVGLLCYNTIVNEKKKNALREKEIENERMKLLMDVNPKAAREEIEEFVRRYFGEYTLYNFVAPKKLYINKEDGELGIKEISKKIMLNISETYVFYFKLLYYINDQDDLLEKITEIVTEQMLSYMVEYNRPKE